MDMVLQERVTLADCLLSMSTFANGCDFTLIFKSDGSVNLDYGCYGLHVNLVQGKRRLLMNWLDRNPSGEIPPGCEKELAELKSRRPCALCGGFKFEKK